MLTQQELKDKADKMEQEEQWLASVPNQFGRIKGAKWFSTIASSEAIVLGQGGIGSWVTLFLARAGLNMIYTFDGDTFEHHNMTGQFVNRDQIGKNKASAVREMVRELSPETTIKAFPKMYEEDSPTGGIVICGFDNMKARKIAFKNWVEYISELEPEQRKFCFFQDGRLLSEQMQIFNIPGNRADLIELYEKEHLFDDSEVEEVACTFKQTTHCAGIIAGQMVGFFTNFLTAAHHGDFRSVPFYFEYIMPLNRYSKI